MLNKSMGMTFNKYLEMAHAFQNLHTYPYYR